MTGRHRRRTGGSHSTCPQPQHADETSPEKGENLVPLTERNGGNDHPDHGEPPVADRRFPHAQEGGGNDGDDDWPNTFQEWHELRQGAVTPINDCQDQSDGHGWQDETESCSCQPAPSSADESEMNGHFRRVWTRNEIGSAEQVEETLARQPAAAIHHLILHHSDMGCRTAEAESPQLQKESHDLLHRQTSAAKWRALTSDQYKSPRNGKPTCPP